MPLCADPSLMVFKALQNACSPGNELPFRAMARKLLAEHRVSEERFVEFSKAGELVSITQIHKALEDYQLNHVRPFVKAGKQPAYARSENANNVAVLGLDTHLGTVLDLTRLGR